MIKRTLTTRSSDIYLHMHVGRSLSTYMLTKMLKIFTSLLGRDLHVVWHFHGTDVRTMPELHRALFVKGFVEKYFVSTPDLLTYSYKMGIKAEYLPNPVDPLIELGYEDESFIRPEVLSYINKISHVGRYKKMIFIPTRQDHTKGLQTFIHFLMHSQVVKRYQNKVFFAIIKWGNYSGEFIKSLKKMNLDVIVLPLLNRHEYLKVLKLSDIVIGQFKLGVFGLTELEALALGKPLIRGNLLPIVHSMYPERIPVYEVNLDNFDHVLSVVINEDENSSYNEILKRKHFIKNFHSIKRVTELYTRALKLKLA
ncbi:MAG: glycosyltransferase [Candidatus Verstraetearchaeota archaeon]|nr:glycosyltransferase [Candidatus Verstraetearchaeota archaeon]